MMESIPFATTMLPQAPGDLEGLQDRHAAFSKAEKVDANREERSSGPAGPKTGAFNLVVSQGTRPLGVIDEVTEADRSGQ